MGDEAGIRARQGLLLDGADPARLGDAIDAAVDYRGDVTLHRRSTGGPVIGYVFARAAEGAVRMLPRDGGAPIEIPLEDVRAIEFTGRDTAEGKSFEAWVKKYVEKKLAGGAASLEPEPLE